MGRKMAGMAALALLLAWTAFASASMERPSGYVTAWLFENAELGETAAIAELPDQPLAATGSATAHEAPVLVALAGLVVVAGAAGFAFARHHRT